MKIAIIGGGVSGLVCASLLHERHDITLFEASATIGGHSHTARVSHEGREIDVDTGFIVFNRGNYPEFCRLVIDRLGVPVRPAPMTFGVRCERTGLEWGGGSLGAVFAQRRNLARPAFLRMLRDIGRFGREAPAAARELGEAATLGEFLRERGYSHGFAVHYLKPMAGAIWSAPASCMEGFPLAFLVRFFENHGMLTPRRAPRWLTIDGGSREYVRRLVAPFEDRVRLDSRVASVAPGGGAGAGGRGVRVSLASGETETFDEAVMACHSDQSLAMLPDPTDAERETLAAMPYQPNDTVLHTDATLLPRARAAWSAWNALLPADPPADQAGALVTYNLSILQSLPSRTPLLVSLNQTKRIDPRRVLGRFTYAHPVCTRESIAAQERWPEISGVRGLHFCGAYWGNGFHEDGVRSALRVADALGARAGSPSMAEAVA